MAFDLGRYLDRIGLTDVPPGAAGLIAVQQAHMSTIPFENIEPLLGDVPRLDTASLVDKLVSQKRGGYCFEHNTLFALALAALGYAPQAFLARVRNGAPQGGARTHQFIRVETGGENWLCDTGFGGHGPLHPIPMAFGKIHTAPNGAYRLVPDTSSGETLLERQSGDAWVALYGFDGTPPVPIDFDAANFLCARWNGAPFSRNLMMALHGPKGRVTLFNRALQIGLPPDTETHTLTTQDTLADALRDRFRLNLSDATTAQIWDRIKDAPLSRA